ncbi:hypothetical protein QYE76_026077 [Lolium multiflorum]|uniref:Uncharacterized protein n=1 Tax=Lolium multiflorum TaxID=4521 RepID=A0AAD8RGT1_LOLMU|nr:hypothetical protein QYE76_026077 [Lolium multiflorum]
MPPWDSFRELYLLCFWPPIRGSRLAELGHLPFTTTVRDFAERFQALACHAPGVTGQQRAELFIGGLPDHIRVDVELQAPDTSQTNPTKEIFSELDEINAQGLIFPRSFQKTERITKWGDEAPPRPGRAAKVGASPPCCVGPS